MTRDTGKRPSRACHEHDPGPTVTRIRGFAAANVLPTCSDDLTMTSGSIVKVLFLPDDSDAVVAQGCGPI